MLAWTGPRGTLDTRRLGKSSAEPEDLHGARDAHRIQRRVRHQWRTVMDRIGHRHC
jgi:hypothetical protein